ncbi:THAP domain-containing protein 11 [Lepisosteus oculatus]|uniref:THAP domain-containing protein 11 n=1 Tax=Lepisosteus oculatus TaxID=7918 RepID=W5NM42_LEPOC|nr:PREDICTED: THAP domain-containing protein 11 [Lepisosteus oculatus]
MPGFTCCVPGCYNNSHRDRELRFYTFPKDPVQREIWLKNISRAGVSGCFSTFQPTTGHRVCSIHFPGGRKTYSIRVPTLFPLRGVNERKTRRGRNKKVSAAAYPAVVAAVAANVDATSASCALGAFASEEVSSCSAESAGEAGRREPLSLEVKPIDLTVQADGSCVAVVAASSLAQTGCDHPLPAAAPAAHQLSKGELATLGATDHSYSLSSGTTSAELLKKLNEQRDIIALMEVKMKEMKSTIRQLKITEAKLREEVRDRDRMLSMAVIRKKHGM